MHTVLQEDYILKRQEIFAQSASLLYQSSPEALVEKKVKIGEFIKFTLRKNLLLRSHLDPYFRYIFFTALTAFFTSKYNRRKSLITHVTKIVSQITNYIAKFE